MKKLFFVALIFFFYMTNRTFAQSAIFGYDSTAGSHASFLALTDPVYNITNNSVNMYWVKILKNYPLSWIVEVCISQCFTSDSETFTMTPHITDTMVVEFTSMNVSATGILKILLYNVGSNRNNGKIATFVAKMTTGINDSPGNINLSLFPDPADDNLNITSQTILNSIDIFDLSGKIVLRQKLINSAHANINVSGLPKGYYLANVTAVNGNQVTVSFVKN